MIGKRWLLIIGMLLGAVLATPVAEAHANLVTSEPAAGALLAVAPKELVFTFSEELDPSFTRVQLYNSTNQVINAGPGTIDPSAPLVLRLALGTVPKGSYTAIWRARSAADGHISEGSVPFGIGVAATTTSLIPALGAPDPALEAPPIGDAATRWLMLTLLALAFGGLPFGMLVWRPALRRAQSTTVDYALADSAMTTTIRQCVLVGGGLFLAANGIFLAVQAADAAGVAFFQALGAPVLQLLGGRSGQLILARLVLTLLLGALAWRLPAAGRGSTCWWWGALILTSAIILTFSLNAHGAAEAQGAALAIALDWLHIAAMVAWIGGLLPLATAIRAARRAPETALPLAMVIPRFSWLALPCVVILTLTGLYSYFLHINQLDLLAVTSYGRALLVKLGLFALLLLLGAINLGVFSRRLRASGNRLAGAFRRTVRLELVLGIILLLAVGAMTSVAPSQTAWEQHERQGLAQSVTTGDVELTLRVAPAQIGDNEWAVDVTDGRPGAQATPAKVLLRFDMQGMEMGKLQADTQTSNHERYTTRGSFTSMGGRWNVEVVLRRAGFDDVTHRFQIDIVRSPMAAVP